MHDSTAGAADRVMKGAEGVAATGMGMLIHGCRNAHRLVCGKRCVSSEQALGHFQAVGQLRALWLRAGLRSRCAVAPVLPLWAHAPIPIAATPSAPAMALLAIPAWPPAPACQQHEFRKGLARLRSLSGA